MAEPDQPKKETVRIELPHPAAVNPPEPTLEPHETVRVQWRVGETARSSTFSPSPQPAPENDPSTDPFPLPNPPAASRPLPASVRPASVSAPSGPQTETVRATLNPGPLRSSPKKAQSLIAMPQVAPKNPVSPKAPADKTSMLLYWVLLGLSAFILIIQIWIYFS